MRDGARSVLEKALEAAGPEDVPAAQAAALAVALARTTGGCMNVLLPYCDRLDAFALWHRQLWAESLGKNGQGMTPIRGLGPVDQHSQLQLYLEGPADKLFTVLCVLRREEPGRVCLRLTPGSMAPSTLGGRRSVTSLPRNKTPPLQRWCAAVAQRACCDCPDSMSGRSELCSCTSCWKLYSPADLLGVNPFDQPAVEEGKILARELVAERAAAGAVD